MFKSVSCIEPVLPRLWFPVVALYFLSTLSFCHKNQFRLPSSVRLFQPRVLSGIEAFPTGWDCATMRDAHAKRLTKEDQSIVVKGATDDGLRLGDLY